MHATDIFYLLHRAGTKTNHGPAAASDLTIRQAQKRPEHKRFRASLVLGVKSFSTLLVTSLPAYLPYHQKRLLRWLWPGGAGGIHAMEPLIMVEP